MINYTIIGLAVLAGYIATVLGSLVTTMGLTTAMPRFVVADHKVRGAYKLAHELLWLLCTILGGFVTARVGMGVAIWKQEFLLIGVLVLMLWRNTWEARQRGTAHQILISLLTVAGVLAGFSLRFKYGL